MKKKKTAEDCIQDSRSPSRSRKTETP